MKRNSITAPPCDQWGPDDGVPPQELEKRESRGRQSRKGNDHRSLQYCKEARLALEGALACDIGEPCLDDLAIDSVHPIRGCSLLEVVFSTATIDLADIQDMHQRLTQVEGVFRSAIAGSTHRKKVARLQFRIIPRKDVGA